MSGFDTTGSRPLRTLFVCTGNICRSPMAAAIFKARAGQRSLPVAVASCGLLKSGRPATTHGVSVMADWGVDMSQKVSRQIDHTMVRGADLTLAMATHHARRAVGEDPASRHKVFLLRELVAIAPVIGPRLVGANESPQEWIARANAARTVSYAEDLPLLEVEDPIGEPRPAYEAMQRDLDELLYLVLGHIWPPG